MSYIKYHITGGSLLERLKKWNKERLEQNKVVCAILDRYGAKRCIVDEQGIHAIEMEVKPEHWVSHKNHYKTYRPSKAKAKAKFNAEIIAELEAAKLNTSGRIAEWLGIEGSMIIDGLRIRRIQIEITFSNNKDGTYILHVPSVKEGQRQFEQIKDEFCVELKESEYLILTK